MVQQLIQALRRKLQKPLDPRVAHEREVQEDSKYQRHPEPADIRARIIHSGAEQVRKQLGER